MPSTVPTIKDRGDLLAYLRDEGYKGKAILADVEAFITDTLGGLELADPFTKKSVELKDLWAKTKRANTGAADGSEEVEVDDNPVTKAVNDGAASRVRAANAKASGLAAQGERTFSIKDFRSNLARKSYGRMVAAGKSKFGTADDMEAFNAAYRQRLLQIYPLVDSEGYYSKAMQAEDRSIVGKDGTELVNTLGGALVTTDFRPDMIWLTEPYGICRAVANMVTMTGGQTRFPRKTGIPAFTHAGQGTAMTALDITYDTIELVPKQIYGLIKTNRQLFNHSAINIGDDIASSMLEAYWNRIDSDYFNATGESASGNQAGLVQYFLGSHTSQITYTTGNSWSGCTKDNLEAVIGTPTNCNPSRFAWVMSRQAFANVVMRLAVGVGGTQPSNLLQARYIDGSNQGELFGYPVYFCPSLPTTTPSSSSGTATSSSIWAYFGDFMGSSMVGLRDQLEITPSEHAGFASNQIWTRGVGEVAVVIHGDGRTSSAGPIAALSN